MRALAIFVFLVYFISLIYPNSERYIYNNEIFAIIGCAIFATPKLSKNIRDKTTTPIYLFIIYGAALTLYSIPNILNTGLYLSARTMPIWYSTFSFFLGAYCLRRFKIDSIARILNKLKYASSISLFITSSRLTPQVFLALTSFGKFAPFIILMIAFLAAKPGSTTVTAILLTVIFFSWIHNRSLREIKAKRLIMAFAIALLASLYFLYPTLNEFLDIGYEGFQGDNNALWRIMFWTYLFNEKFLHNPILGIGFGTPLFDLISAPRFITTDDGTRFTEYTLGTHNSFVFTAIRMGAIGFLLLLLAIISIFSFAIKELKKTKAPQDKRILTAIILANFMFLNSALFNVVMESPLYASNYWITLGIMYSFTRLLYEKRLKMESLQS